VSQGIEVCRRDRGVSQGVLEGVSWIEVCRRGEDWLRPSPVPDGWGHRAGRDRVYLLLLDQALLPVEDQHVRRLSPHIEPPAARGMEKGETGWVGRGGEREREREREILHQRDMHGTAAAVEGMAREREGGGDRERREKGKGDR
jgi:hypothetical protein